MARVVLAMSGGVDSSVAAHLLRDAGPRSDRRLHAARRRIARRLRKRPAVRSGVRRRRATAGLLPIISHAPGHKQGCCTASDAADARRVADRLDIPFYALDFREEFGRIMDYFVEEYTAGRTPNPCVVCNNWLKFGTLAEYADQVGAEFIATGHYAQLLRQPGEDVPACVARRRSLRRISRTCCLACAARSCAACCCRSAAIAKTKSAKWPARSACASPTSRTARTSALSPRGTTPISSAAAAARRIARARSSPPPGEVLGRHDGIENFTVGQRKGIGLAFGEPRYVIRLESDTRRVVIGTRDELACRASRPAAPTG